MSDRLCYGDQRGKPSTCHCEERSDEATSFLTNHSSTQSGLLRRSAPNKNQRVMAGQSAYDP